MKGFLYILQCSDGSYYVGSTSNLEVRLAQHQAGEGGAYTAQRLPVKLVFSYQLASPYEAFLRERQVKCWSRKKKEALIRGDYEALVGLSKSRRHANSPRTPGGRTRDRTAIPGLSRDPSTGSG